MKICVDENVKRSIVTLLTQEGHDVVRVQDALELGDDDEEIVRFCREHDRVLLTNDADFFDFETHPGILFLDTQHAEPRNVITAIQRVNGLVTDLSNEEWHVPDGWI